MALQVPVYSLKGEKVGTQDLNPAVFGVSFKDSLVHQTVTAQQSSGRQVLAHTKGRSEVRGGGRKPWKQKGTGRARHGSRRSPLWSGGGVTFGPTSARNFAQQINKKMRKQALRMVLSDKVKNERFVVIDEWKLDEAKTKKLNSVLALLPSKGKKMTLVTKPTDKEVLRSVKNLPNVGSIGVGSLNVVDLLKREYVIIPKKLVTELEKTYAK